MFKTALRNHLDLSNLADNKANIMLSVNALIITIAIFNKTKSISPTETKPLERIEEIRVKAMADGHHGNSGARHILGFRETVGKRGLLDENYLPLRSAGFTNIPGLLSLMPVALRMLLRGKNPPIFPHTIDKVDEVKKTFARFEELRK